MRLQSDIRSETYGLGWQATQYVCPADDLTFTIEKRSIYDPPLFGCIATRRLAGLTDYPPREATQYVVCEINPALCVDRWPTLSGPHPERLDCAAG